MKQNECRIEYSPTTNTYYFVSHLWQKDITDFANERYKQGYNDAVKILVNYIGDINENELKDHNDSEWLLSWKQALLEEIKNNC